MAKKPLIKGALKGTDTYLLVKKLLMEATVFELLESSKEPSPTDKFSRFLPATFFKIWFQQKGKPYFFLFKKNLQVTNVQFAELIALLQQLITDDGDTLTDLQFVSHREFIDSLRDLLSSFQIQNRAEALHSYHLIADYYHKLLRSTIVLDAYYGSCSVFLPPNLELDLAVLCGRAGYIHSCGPAVYIRNVNKADAISFGEAIDIHTAKHPINNTNPSRLLVVYAHEDFSKNDDQKGKTDSLIHGLSDAKLHVERFYMGDQRLVSVIKSLGDGHLSDTKLEIASPNTSEHKQTNDRSLWLIKDYSVNRNGVGRGEEVYYICYEQCFKNENPFHVFDENKPAWITHTTTPHTLVGAMLNVARPGLPESPRVCDPFVGTGTTIFEALRLYPGLILGTDKSKLVEILCTDNLKIFQASAEQLNELVLFLTNVLSQPIPEPLTISTPRPDTTDFVIKLTENPESFVVFTAEEGEIVTDDDSLAKLLRHQKLEERMLTYLHLRVMRRREGAQFRGTLNWTESFRRECERLRNEVQALRNLRNREEKERRDGITLISGLYSDSCTIDPETIAAQWRTVVISSSDVMELEGGKFDLIIADPPYGFNTKQSIEPLADLYRKMIPKMVAALRDNGQLMLVLPERSYIGRRSPYFTHKGIVTQQVLHACGAELEIVTRSLPEPTRLYKPPYYWRSEKALARTILHFKFRKRG